MNTKTNIVNVCTDLSNGYCNRVAVGSVTTEHGTERDYCKKHLAEHQTVTA